MQWYMQQLQAARIKIERADVLYLNHILAYVDSQVI